MIYWNIFLSALVVILKIVYCVDSQSLDVSLSLEHYYYPTNFELAHNKNLIFDINYNSNYSECKPCSYIVRNKSPNSTPRDVIVGCAIGKAVSLIIFVKSLRTTGSKAQCVFLLDNDAYHGVSNMTKKILESCGGTLINCGSVPYNKKFDKNAYCFLYALEFLRANRGKFDRVIKCDLFDTVFQGDPFTPQFSMTKFNIVDEGAKLSHPLTGKTNVNWIKKHNITKPIDMNFKYFCSGYLGANQDMMIKILTLLMEEINFGHEQNDQGGLNYLEVSGTFAENGIYAVGDRKSEEVRHLALIQLKNNSLGYATCINNLSSYATVVHHYYNSRAFKQTVIKACPKEYPELEDYINNKHAFWS